MRFQGRNAHKPPFSGINWTYFPRIQFFIFLHEATQNKHVRFLYKFERDKKNFGYVGSCEYAPASDKLIFDIFVPQCHLAIFFNLFELKSDAYHLYTSIKSDKWQYHFLEPQWSNLFYILFFLSAQVVPFTLSVFTDDREAISAEFAVGAAAKNEASSAVADTPTGNYEIKSPPWPERIYNSHSGNGVPAIFTS